jgi:hypothetical protein
MSLSWQQLIMIAMIISISVVNPLKAAQERIVEYEYDNAGNIVRIITQEQINPPVLSPLTPAFINAGQTRTFTTTGSNLLGIDVTTEVPGLSIAAISSTASQVSFQLTATSQAPIGNAIIRFTTTLGEVQQTIFVAELGPGLTTDPSPITADLSGTPNSVSLIFTNPRPETETYTIATADTGTATVGATSFTVLAGARQASISITGISEGTTSLQITLAEKFYSYSFPVYVNKSYAELLSDFPDMQRRNLFAEPVGVVIQENNPFLPNTVNTGRVGVQVDSNAAYFSNPVGVLYGARITGLLLSNSVGVLISSRISYAHTTAVGSIYGPVLDSILPASAVSSTTVDFIADGLNLNEIQTVSVVPADDVTIGVISANPQGTQLTVPISIDPGASIGPRELVMQDSNGPVPTRSGSPLTFIIQ